MSNPDNWKGNWRGFKPDTSPVPAHETPKKSPQEQLDEIDSQLDNLEEKRKELLLEIQTAEVFEKILSGEIDLTEEQEKDLHIDCRTVEELDEQTAEDRAAAEEAWDYLREFGSHAGACLSGALAGNQELHPLCTCGWNHVATEIERA
jgi:hypothetical protein